jgi:predicted  nucleic acid-binding Zn-ribbon protein
MDGINSRLSELERKLLELNVQKAELVQQIGGVDLEIATLHIHCAKDSTARYGVRLAKLAQESAEYQAKIAGIELEQQKINLKIYDLQKEKEGCEKEIEELKIWIATKQQGEALEAGYRRMLDFGNAMHQPNKEGGGPTT